MLGIFCGLMGALLGLALLKFGNPVIFEKQIEPPAGALEILLRTWPISWSYPLLGLMAVWSFFLARWRRPEAVWLALLPLTWLAWQFFAAVNSVDADYTRMTLKHFVACVACYYLGLVVLARESDLCRVWLGVLIGFLAVLGLGFHQHFGGLAETRRYFFLYIYPNVPEVSPEMLEKMSSPRIFSTLFYPNTLAGCILLMLPSSLVFFWRSRRFTTASKWFLMGSIFLASLACLFWSGSKAGWLVFLVMGLVALLNADVPRRMKLAMLLVVLVCGLTGFFVKYAAFFKKGAPSVVARFDYWQSAAQTALEHPWLGTGPGTFAITYKQRKRPDAEMARLAHNDFIQQACDSGWPGGLLYVGLVAGTLARFYRKSRRDLHCFAVWLALFGWSLHSAVEFPLYIPALAWAAFLMMGWLGAVNPVDAKDTASYAAPER